MIQDIHPHRIDMTFSVHPPADTDFVIVLKGNKVLLAAEGDGRSLPEYSGLRQAVPGLADRLVRMFTVDDRAVYFHDGDPGDLAGHVYDDIMRFREFSPDWQAFAGVTGCHLGQWYAANRFCGSCGAAMAPKTDERAMQCGACGMVVYPRISPAVIVGVVDDDRILLTRYANRPGSRLGALIAGFMEIGETLEETVQREVFEEVGLRVKNPRYYKSQPWAFSGSVLVGFYVDLDGSDEITMDTVELQEAVWVRRDDLDPNLDSISLTAEMIETFRQGKMP